MLQAFISQAVWNCFTDQRDVRFLALYWTSFRCALLPSSGLPPKRGPTERNKTWTWLIFPHPSIEFCQQCCRLASTQRDFTVLSPRRGLTHLQRRCRFTSADRREALRGRPLLGVGRHGWSSQHFWAPSKSISSLCLGSSAASAISHATVLSYEGTSGDASLHIVIILNPTMCWCKWWC